MFTKKSLPVLEGTAINWNSGWGLLYSFQKQVCSTCFVNQDIVSFSWCIFLINMGGETISNMFNITHDMFNVQVKKPITAAAFTDLKSSMPKKVIFHIDH